MIVQLCRVLTSNDLRHPFIHMTIQDCFQSYNGMYWARYRDIFTHRLFTVVQQVGESLIKIGVRANSLYPFQWYFNLLCYEPDWPSNFNKTLRLIGHKSVAES